MSVSALPLSPLTGDGLRTMLDRVSVDLMCAAWALGDKLAEGGDVGSYFPDRLMELAAERNAISERYNLERVA